MSIDHLTLIVDGPVLQDGAIIDRLFEAGCDDAATGRSDGLQYVDFDREAASLDEAVLSAVRDVEHVDGASVVRVADAGVRVWKCLMEELLFLDVSFFEKICILRV